MLDKHYRDPRLAYGTMRYDDTDMHSLKLRIYYWLILHNSEVRFTCKSSVLKGA